MLQILGWAYDRQPTAVIYSGVAALLFLIALSLRQRFIRPPLAPHVPPFLLRDPKGKLCFITNAFTTPEGLALVERLLGRGAHIILLCHPEDAADPATLQLYAILKHNHPAGSTTLYIEAVDLNSAEAVRSFAKTFESKGAKVPGALGETVGRKPICGLICFQHPARPQDQSLELARALLPSFERSHNEENPDPVLQRGGGPAEAQTRVIQVLPSLRYAAASAQRLLYNTTAVKTAWQFEAADSLKLALLTSEAQRHWSPAADAPVLFLSLSTGLTRQRLSKTFSSVSSALLVLFYPLVWFFGKSGEEAAVGIEWALLHPHQASAPPALEIPERELVQPGSLYRDGVNAGLLLPEFSDEALRETLWQSIQSNT